MQATWLSKLLKAMQRTHPYVQHKRTQHCLSVLMAAQGEYHPCRAESMSGNAV